MLTAALLRSCAACLRVPVIAALRGAEPTVQADYQADYSEAMAPLTKARLRPLSAGIDGLSFRERTGNAVRDMIPNPQLPPQL
jgi:hypothetical protein